MLDTVTPCLWFDTDAEEAVRLYTRTFAGSRVVRTSYYGEGAPLPAGTPMMIEFELGGRAFTAINGGPRFRFSPAISMMASCDTQEEIDRLWETLSAGGETQMCGWLVDRFGLSWQVVPAVLPELMGGDPERSARVMRALWSMEKLDLARLLEVADPEAADPEGAEPEGADSAP